jgi:hypothetical protein
MNDSPPNPEPDRPRTHTEYEDPHFHDEEPEIQHDEAGRRPGQAQPVAAPAAAPAPLRRLTPRQATESFSRGDPDELVCPPVAGPGRARRRR